MPKLTLSINIAETNRKVKIQAPVKDSLHGSMLSDRLNDLPYLKVFERIYNAPYVRIQAHTIPNEYTLEKLFADLDNMSDLIIQPDESDIQTT